MRTKLLEISLKECCDVAKPKLDKVVSRRLLDLRRCGHLSQIIHKSEFIRHTVEIEGNLRPGSTRDLVDQFVEKADARPFSSAANFSEIKLDYFDAKDSDDHIQRKIFNVFRALLFSEEITLNNLPTELITIEVVKTLHKIIMDGLLENSGEFRKARAAPIVSIREYVHPSMIHTKLKQLLSETGEALGEVWKIADNEVDLLQKLIVTATVFFGEFLRIHPFGNGNGRLARVLFSIVMKPFMKIHMPIGLPREKYLSGLSSRWPAVNRPSVYVELIECVADCVENVITNCYYLEGSEYCHGSEPE
jgi:fido (protein-threonine AMPylation protein)